MSLELTGVHGLLKRHKLFTHKLYISLKKLPFYPKYSKYKAFRGAIPQNPTAPHLPFCPKNTPISQKAIPPDSPPGFQ